MQELNETKQMQSVFVDIYRGRKWGGRESVSGPGSDPGQTEVVRQHLPNLLKEYRIKSVLDAPCGDFNWMAQVVNHVDSYIGIDVVPQLIARNRASYATSRVQFECLNITSENLPKADLVLCRDCLVHLSGIDALAALTRFQQSGSEYLLTTTYDGVDENREIHTGAWRPLNLELAPFEFQTPLALLDERADLRYEELSGRKLLALWRLSEIDTETIAQRIRSADPNFYRPPWDVKMDLAVADIESVAANQAVIVIPVASQLDTTDFKPREFSVVPFLEKEGGYWGEPRDDEHAIEELERMRRRGIRYLAFLWRAFWWKDYYSGFVGYLRRQHSCVLENDRVLIFALNQAK